MATDLGLLLLRLAIGLIFAAHGAQKVFGWWSGPGLSGWRGAMESMNIRPAGFWAPISAAAELLGGLALALGLFTPFVAAALLGQSIVIIGHVHLPRGFWNRENGIEFPLALAAGVLAVALVGAGSYSLDAALGLTYATELQLGLIVLGVLGGLVALAVPRLAAASEDRAAESH
jgi:putative oxidoreductase